MHRHTLPSHRQTKPTPRLQSQHTNTLPNLHQLRANPAHCQPTGKGNPSHPRRQHRTSRHDRKTTHHKSQDPNPRHTPRNQTRPHTCAPPNQEQKPAQRPEQKDRPHHQTYTLSPHGTPNTRLCGSTADTTQTQRHAHKNQAILRMRTRQSPPALPQHVPQMRQTTRNSLEQLQPLQNLQQTQDTRRTGQQRHLRALRHKSIHHTQLGSQTLETAPTAHAKHTTHRHHIPILQCSHTTHHITSHYNRRHSSRQAQLHADTTGHQCPTQTTSTRTNTCKPCRGSTQPSHRQHHNREHYQL